MGLIVTGIPRPTDYLGTLWTLAGVEGLRVLCHGTSGCTFYDFIGFRDLEPTSYGRPFFSTGMNETDVVMGGEDRLAEAVREVDRRHRPGVIALVNVTVAGLMGTDPHAIALELQPEVQARLIAFSGAGMRGSAPEGEAEALATLAREVADGAAPPAAAAAVNIIGPTLETFNWASDGAELVRLLGLLGVQVAGVWTAGTSLAALRAAGQARLNLVVRETGLEAAAVLQQRFGTPYLYGLPFGTAGTAEWLRAVAERLNLPDPGPVLEAEQARHAVHFANLSPLRELHHDLKVVVAAPYEYALGLTSVLAGEWGLHIKLVVLPWTRDAAAARAALAATGAERVLVEPEEEALAAALAEVGPHILLGSANESRLAPGAAVHVRVAHPSYDVATFYDGAPFAGLRGVRYLAQTLVNGMLAARAAGKFGR